MTGTLERTDTGTFAAVRPVDPLNVGAVEIDHDLPLAWGEAIEAWQVAQHGRSLADVIADTHADIAHGRTVFAQVEIADPVIEVQPASPKPTEIEWAELPPDPVQAYFDADSSDDIPGRVVPGDGNPALAAAYHGKREGWTPKPRDTSGDMPGRLPRTMLEPALIDFDDVASAPPAQPPPPVDTAERRSWSAEWAAFRDEAKDMWQYLRQSLTWWRTTEED
jgi:hypothetical protein